MTDAAVIKLYLITHDLAASGCHDHRRDQLRRSVSLYRRELQERGIDPETINTDGKYVKVVA